MAEYGWMATLNTLDIDEIIFEDYVDCADRLSSMLRNELGCNMVIAMTHMRVPNDERLCLEAKDVDFILGGHDHIYRAQVENQTLMLKSGSDYMNYSELTITPLSGEVPEECTNPTLFDDTSESGKVYNYFVKGKYTATLIKHDITRDIPPHPEALKHVLYYENLMNKVMKKHVCYTESELDTRFSQIRANETVIGNFIADLMRKHFSSDCALLNAGTVRSDVIY